MKLRIEVDSPDTLFLRTSDVKIFIDNNECGYLTGIKFSADCNDTWCSLILESLSGNAVDNVMNITDEEKSEIKEKGYAVRRIDKDIK